MPAGIVSDQKAIWHPYRRYGEYVPSDCDDWNQGPDWPVADE